MSTEENKPQKHFFALPKNLNELSDIEIEDLAEQIILEFLSRQK
jgi:uncharacterized protein (DUF2164 family)